MKLRQANPFTLIELLVVIGIIGILATVVLPAVGDAMYQAKITASQVAAKTIEEEILKFNASSSESLNSIPEGTTQDKIVLVLAGVNKITDPGTVDADNEIPAADLATYEGDTFYVGAKAYKPRINSKFFETDSASNVKMIKNNFGQVLQVVRRKTASKGTVAIIDTIATAGDISGAGTDFTGVKKSDTNLMVFSLDEDKLIIGKKGLADSDNDGESKYGADLEFPAGS